VTDKFYTTTVALLSGQVYKFKIQAMNSVGYSLPSEELAVLVAQVPDTPAAPTTSIVGDKVQIDWTIPYDGSTPITGYIITIRHQDGITYTEETANCNGLDLTIITDHQCAVLISDLIKAPYHLPWGSSIFAKVIAINSIGNSAVSDAGNGAVILTNPDAPTDLANVPAITTSS
jgi:hypothetical protein